MLFGTLGSASFVAPSAPSPAIAGSLASTVGRFGRWLCSEVSPVISRIKGYLDYGAASPRDPVVSSGDSGLVFYEKAPLFGTRHCASMAEFIDRYIHPGGKHIDGSPLLEDDAQRDAECIAMFDTTCGRADGSSACPSLKFKSWSERLVGFLCFSYGLASYGVAAYVVVDTPAQHSVGDTLWLSIANRAILCPKPGDPYYGRANHHVVCAPLLKIMSPDDQPESHSQTDRVIQYADHISIDGDSGMIIVLEKPIPASKMSGELSLFITTDQLTTAFMEHCLIRDLSSRHDYASYNKTLAEHYVNLSEPIICDLSDQKKKQMRGNATELFQTHIEMFEEFSSSPECYLSIPQDREGLIHYLADFQVQGRQQRTTVLFTLEVIPFDVLKFNYWVPVGFERDHFLTNKDYQFAETTFTLQNDSPIIGKSFNIRADSVVGYLDFKSRSSYGISQCGCEGAEPGTLIGKIHITLHPSTFFDAASCTFWFPRQIKSVKCFLVTTQDDNNPDRKIGFTHRYTLLRPDGSDVADEPELSENKSEAENKGKARGLPSKKVANLKVARSQAAEPRKVHAHIKDEL